MKAKAEIFNFHSKEDQEQFEQAVNNTSKLTMISNESILFNRDNFNVEIYPTTAQFLVQVGVEYYKVLHNINK